MGSMFGHRFLTRAQNKRQIKLLNEGAYVGRFIRYELLLAEGSMTNTHQYVMQ